MPRVRTLIVDDEVDIAEMVAIIAGKEGLTTRIATTAVEGVDMLWKHYILITDFNLHNKLTGLDLARLFKQLNPAGVVVLLTGSIHDVTDRNVDFLLKKPAGPKEISAVVKRAYRRANNHILVPKLLVKSRAIVERSKLLQEMAASAHIRARQLTDSTRAMLSV